MLTFSDAFNHWKTDKQALHGYGPMYSRLFPDERRESVTAVLEIGVEKGLSLMAWRDLFPNAMITGIDKYPERLDLPSRVQVWYGDATDAGMVEIIRPHGPFDLIVDDGSHSITDQIKSMELFFPLLKPGGVYVIEEFAWHLYGMPSEQEKAQAVVRIKPEE